jgi:hypothetical protein
MDDVCHDMLPAPHSLRTWVHMLPCLNHAYLSTHRMNHAAAAAAMSSLMLFGSLMITRNRAVLSPTKRQRKN